MASARRKNQDLRERGAIYAKKQQIALKWGSYREQAHEIQAEEEVDALGEAVEANGQRGAVRVATGQRGPSKWKC